MATTVIKSSPTHGPAPIVSLAANRVFGAIDAVYRFLASLKLAVISLTTLAAVLAYATFFESWYGAAAVQEWIYMSPGFALLLAFLGANILCAALIRFPWKKRQTGFVITHAGLLILLAGSWYSLQHADEGQLGMLEGDVSSQMVRIDDPVIRARELDANTRQPVRESTIPFQPGFFPWGQGTPRPRWLATSAFPQGHLRIVRLAAAGGSQRGPERPRRSVPIGREGPPARLDADGRACGRPRRRAHGQDSRPLQGAREAEHSEIFDDESGGPWFKLERRLYRSAKNVSPALFAFMYADRPEMVEDFLSPPESTGPEGAARFRYRDKSGAERKYDWPLEGQAGKSITLPDSDLTATFVKVAQIPTSETGLAQDAGRAGDPRRPLPGPQGGRPRGRPLRVGVVADGPERDPVGRGRGRKAQDGLVRIDYSISPVLDPKTNGRFGQVEVMGTPDGSSYYRVFGRGKEGKSEIRSSGRAKPGEEIIAFGGTPDQPMTITFEVEEYLPSGVEKDVCVPMVLPQGKMGRGDPCHARRDDRRWPHGGVLDPPLGLRSTRSTRPSPSPSGAYEIAYDTDRKDLGFELKLDDFEVGFDPGTEKASSFASQVRLTDEAMGIKDKPITISMNEPLTHRGWTFYQSSYERVEGPADGGRVGQFKSVFQVGSDAGRGIKMLGCVLIVAGAFVQFYMRAGIFTDGGKRERARAAAKANPGGKAVAAPEPEADEPL